MEPRLRVPGLTRTTAVMLGRTSFKWTIAATLLLWRRSAKPMVSFQAFPGKNCLPAPVLTLARSIRDLILGWVEGFPKLICKLLSSEISQVLGLHSPIASRPRSNLPPGRVKRPSLFKSHRSTPTIRTTKQASPSIIPTPRSSIPIKVRALFPFRLGFSSTRMPFFYTGGPYQQAVSAVSDLPNTSYGGTGYSTYGFEFWGNPNDRENTYITWFVDGVKTWTVNAAALKGDSISGIGNRLISEEPMVRLSIISRVFDHP